MVGKVLVADDNLNIQRSVTAALKAENIEVVAVSHGEAAVRKIPEVKPDLILADVFMPVRTGYEVCEFVKTNPNLSHIPVLLLVGALEPLDQKEVSRVHADGFLKKPFESGQLVSTVKDYLAKMPRKPSPEMQQAAQEFEAAIPAEEAVEEAPPEAYATRPEPLKVEMAEADKPLVFGEMLGEEAPAAEPAPSVAEIFAAVPAEAETPAIEPSPAALDFSSFQTAAEEPAPAFEAPAEEPPPPPSFEAQAAAAFEAPAAAEAPAGGAELLIEKEQQAWEIQTSISARDPLLAESTTDFMETPPQVQLPSPPAWEGAGFVTSEEEEAAAAEAPGAPAVDPALVEAVVQQVMERLTPQIVEAVAREVVRPLAESLLKEKLEQQS